MYGMCLWVVLAGGVVYWNGIASLGIQEQVCVICGMFGIGPCCFQFIMVWGLLLWCEGCAWCYCTCSTCCHIGHCDYFVWGPFYAASTGSGYCFDKTMFLWCLLRHLGCPWWVWGQRGPAIWGQGHHGQCQFLKCFYVKSCRIKYQAVWSLKVKYSFPKWSSSMNNITR